MQPCVIIILVNWNSYEDTAECLHSLFSLSYSNYKIIVVDNASSGNDTELFEKEFGEKIVLIKHQSNSGFAGGNNIGIIRALKEGADYVFLLNNDTTVEPDFLDKLVYQAENDTTAGILTPLINYYSAPSKVWCAGGSIVAFKGSGFPEGENQDQKVYRDKRYVTFASGCGLLIRREVLEKVGLLDESYFLYLEDTDYCMRTIRAGYKILFVPESRIYHKVNRTTAKEIATLPLYYTTRNRLLFSKKMLGMYFPAAFIYIGLTMILKIIFWKLKHEEEKIGAVNRAFKDFFSGKSGKTEFNTGFGK